MLSSYQETVRYLIGRDECPGVSTQELDLFKSQFRTSTYTCRLSLCPHATIGFETKQVWVEHEISHMHRWSCKIPGCQFPPLFSATALKNHERKYHSPKLQRKAIRRAIMPQATPSLQRSALESLYVTPHLPRLITNIPPSQNSDSSKGIGVSGRENTDPDFSYNLEVFR
ncbi:hypothetical protein GGR53DRAFT_497942 [Hypoxylon sp. FL1150]|nr:hypothetical protein GGR53DRAFT_497942 [Hypoxylon sp. FL1150]